jgi:hypothetical protein
MDHGELLATLATADVERRDYVVRAEPSDDLPWDMDVRVLARDRDDRWYWGFGERGSFDVRRYFDSEDEACRYFFAMLTSPPTSADRLESEETLRRRAGEVLPRTLDAMDGWMASHRAGLESRGISVRITSSTEEGVVRTGVLARGTRRGELIVRGPGRDSAYRRVDTGPEPRDLGNRVHLVHPKIVEEVLQRLAYWL